MKKNYFILLIFISQISLAQNTNAVSQSGIYMNWQDYDSGKLSYILNCDSSSGKIRLNHFFSKNYIDIIEGEKRIRLNKDSIFGYRDCEQNNYRFYKSYDKEYHIIESRAIIIYLLRVPVTASTGKIIGFVSNYFFSVTLNSAIIPLTVINLKRAFPGNLKFHDILDLEFYDIKNISAYDDIHKMYKVNYLLSQTITN